MDSEPAYKLSVGLVLLLMTAIRTRYARYNRSVRISLAFGEVLFLLLGTLAFLFTFLYLFTPWIGFARLFLPGWLRWVGMAIALLGDLLFWWSHAELGRNWSPSPEILTGQTLVTSGPYRYVRHPMYSSWLLVSTGISLLTANWLLALPYLGSATVLYLMRVPGEERMMESAFGDRYREYAARTGRLFPRWHWRPA